MKAIGSTDTLPDTLKRAFDPATHFQPLPLPGPHDWLAVHEEKGQTYDAFRRGPHNIPTAIRRTIELQPLGEFVADRSPATEQLREGAACTFAMDVKIRAPLSLDQRAFKTRVNDFTHKRQILTSDVLELLRENLPAEAFCVLALTMEDLYPEPSWNFVFGEADLAARVGVFSFARYDPLFYSEERGDDYRPLLLRRSLKVLVHETGHMFGLHHCIYFQCVMNGSNHLQESDARPLHFCPVCLRKLHASIGFDVVERYKRLAAFYEKTGLGDEAAWVAARLQHIVRKKESEQESAGERGSGTEK
ncbi:MAG: archaemetzincin [Planctomycetota bacterium]